MIVVIYFWLMARGIVVATIRISYGEGEDDTVIELQTGQAAQIIAYCGPDGQPRHYMDTTYDQSDLGMDPRDTGPVASGTLWALRDAAK